MNSAFPDIVIQPIFWHEDVSATHRSYIKTVPEVVTAAMKRLEAQVAGATLVQQQPTGSLVNYECRPKADVAQLVEQPIRNALSLAYVVVEYRVFRVVLGGSRMSLSTFCTAFCTAV
jgi:hypothetical protein